MGSPHPELRAALMSAIAEKSPRVDRDRLGACFDYSGHAHGDQRRDSGQPYFSHVVEVCLILVELFETRLDTTLACAALLHDVVEAMAGATTEGEVRALPAHADASPRAKLIAGVSLAILVAAIAFSRRKAASMVAA